MYFTGTMPTSNLLYYLFIGLFCQWQYIIFEMNETKLNIFDTSVLDSTTTNPLTKDELVAELVPKLQEILDRNFPDAPQKRKIKIFKDRISFAAPCCGDSAKDMNKKRGNLILEGRYRNMYKCHNCGTCMSMYNFFKKFGQGLSLRAIDYVITNKPAEFDSSYESSCNIDMLYDTEIVDKYTIDREYFKAKCHLEECNVPNAGHMYLVNRRQYDFSKFLYHPGKNLLFVMNLTNTGKIIGVQVRNLNKYIPGGSKYKTYKLSKIYSLFLHEERDIPDEVENLSMTFNIFQINYTYPVTVVEGPMDSFLIKNCIALCGAGHHLKVDMEFRYLFDDDATGRRHAIEKLNQGYQVFMWSKLKKDLNMPKRQKWDINDLVIWAYDSQVRIPNISNYYTSDKLDLLYI